MTTTKTTITASTMTVSSFLVQILLVSCLTTTLFLPKSAAFSSHSAVKSPSKIILPSSRTINDSVSHSHGYSHSSRRRRFTTQLYYVPSSNNDNSVETSSWTMAEDWELMDQLSKFTVGEGTQCRTFWTQMAACTPMLSSKSPEELHVRCLYLQDQQQEKEEEEDSAKTDNSNSQNSNTRSATVGSIPSSRVPSRPPMRFGPSPPLLSQWSIDDWDTRGGNSNKNVMVGQLQDGRTVWLHYHCIGRLQGDPLSDVSSPSVLQLVPGGYVEAIGGRIYELGEAKSRIPASSSATVSSSWTDPPSTRQKVASDAVSRLELKRGESLDWLLPPMTASVSAFLACTVLSACIGYGAGLSLIADGHHPSASPPQGKTHTTTTPSKASLAEQKARAEYRILKEQRLLREVTERLEQDKQEWLDLEQKGIY